MGSRPSALLALGTYAGVVAAVVILPVTVPLLLRLVDAEATASAATVYARTAQIGHALSVGAPLPALDGALHVRAVGVDGAVLLAQGEPVADRSLEDRVCAQPVGVAAAAVDGRGAVASCYDNGRVRVFALWPPVERSTLVVGLYAAAMALIAGLVTALGVAQVLRPVARVSDALHRLGAGGPAQPMDMTGIAELDELVFRMNAAATAVEEREHHILGRVHVIQEMARLVAHEVRNPLQSLELLTTLVADEADHDERRQLAASIHTEIRTLDDVVTRLLREGATRGALRLQLQPCEVGALIDHLCAVRAVDARRRGVRLVAEHGFTGEADLDRALFGRALENVVANAIRAVPAQEGLIRLRSWADGDALVVAVEDNGPGVDPSLGERVFEPNVSGDASTGLGLALTRGVIEAHGGAIRLGRSELGGARFELRVPRHAARHLAR